MEDINKIIATVQKHFSVSLSDNDKKALSEWKNKGFTEKMIIASLEIAKKNTQKVNFPYADKVLNSMEEQKITDDTVEKFCAERNTPKKPAAKSTKKQDMVAVVRCRNCKQGEYKKDAKYRCSIFSRLMCEDDYCSFGRAKK